MFVAMDWQQLVALLIVATAAALLIRGRVRRRKFEFGRPGGAGHCGCSSTGGAASQSSIIFHARKGERPRVLVKMK
jgi:hypothetical protein